MAKTFKFVMRKMNGEYLGEFEGEGGTEIFLPEETRREISRIAIEFGRRRGYEQKTENINKQEC